jgi:c-di-GMP-binding flagellar brake protein YcgR
MIAEEKKPEDVDRRMFERVNMRVPVKYQLEENSTQGEASAANISAAGVGVLTDRDIKPQQRLHLWLKFPDGRQPCYTRGKVVWCSQAREYLWRIGVEFDEINFVRLSRIFENH